MYMYMCMQCIYGTQYCYRYCVVNKETVLSLALSAHNSDRYRLGYTPLFICLVQQFNGDRSKVLSLYH